MQGIQLKDNNLTEIILDMLVNEIGIGTIMDKEFLDNNEEYQEACSKMETIEKMLRELPEAYPLIDRYIEASNQTAAAYDKAVFLKRIKTGFNLRLFLDGEYREG